MGSRPKPTRGAVDRSVVMAGRLEADRSTPAANTPPQRTSWTCRGPRARRRWRLSVPLRTGRPPPSRSKTGPPGTAWVTEHSRSPRIIRSRLAGAHCSKGTLSRPMSASGGLHRAVRISKISRSPHLSDRTRSSGCSYRHSARATGYQPSLAAAPERVVSPPASGTPAGSLQGTRREDNGTVRGLNHVDTRRDRPAPLNISRPGPGLNAGLVLPRSGDPQAACVQAKP